MKPFFTLFSLVLFVCSQRTARANEPYEGRTLLEQSLLDAIVDEFGAVLRDINSANSCDLPLDAPDPPPTQSFSDFFDEGLGGGTLHLSNTEIDGLSNLADQFEITTSNRREIRIRTKLNELNVRGDFSIDGCNGEYETGTFSVVLSNVTVLGIVNLLENPLGKVKVNKVTPTILSEYSHVTMKSELISSGTMLKLVQKLVGSTIRYPLIRLATMEVQFQHPDTPADGSSVEVKPLNRTLFEARKYVDHGFNPYKMEMMSMKGASSKWRIDPFNIHGFSNFFVGELDLMVNHDGTTIEMICSLIGKDLYGKFPITLHQSYVGDYTVGEVEVIAKLVIPTHVKAPPIRLRAVQMQMRRCIPHVHDRATGQSIDDSEFGFDIEGLFCLLLKNDIRADDIKAQIQTEILDRVDTSKLKAKIDEVVEEYMLLYGAHQ